MHFMTHAAQDTFRQWLNLIAAPAMWILSTLPQITDWGRSAKEFSEANNSLLVPYGFAFSIWFPIFVGCIGYAMLQATKANRTREIFRKTGWWTGAGFTGVCIWALFSGWGSPIIARWGTALIFVPTVYCLIKAMLELTRGKEALDKTEKIWVWAPISLIAGWTSIAIFLNWTPLIVDGIGSASPNIVPTMTMFSAALCFAAIMARRSRGNSIYVFPIVWGLAWLAFKALTQPPHSAVIAAAALLGCLILSAVTYASKRAPA